MNFARFVIPVTGLVVLAAAYRGYGWGGVALAAGALVMYLLLQFNRTMQVLRRAAQRPIGHVDSAVMLNAKLKPRRSLMHVVAMTRALGELRTPKDAQPEIYRWTDAGGSWVDATFVNGKLSAWSMTRPEAAAEEAATHERTVPPPIA